jgi:RNA polymerase sigma-70 factor (ECF subfamily)
MTAAEFETILRDHQAMVYSIAFNFFQRSSIAEEIAQDVFLQLYESRPAIRSEAHLVAWLRRTATHRCIDAVRRPGARVEVTVDPLPDVGRDHEQADHFLRDKLQRLIASLPEAQRAVVILRYGEEMEIDEIGRTLNMTARAVWNHLHRGLDLLQAKAARYLTGATDAGIRRSAS